MFCMPWINMYVSAVHCSKLLDLKMRRLTQEINCLVRWLFLVLVVYLLLMPLTLVVMGFIGGIMYGFVSFVCQVNLTCKICCRHRQLNRVKEKLPTGEASTDYQDLVNEIEKKAQTFEPVSRSESTDLTTNISA